MKKIWQKSLASMVSAALCLTAFVGCLTVNAATVHTGTIKSNGVAVATTATEAKLDVAVSVSNVTPGIAYTGLKATTDFGTLKGVEIKSGKVKVEELSTDGETSIPAIDENGSFIIAAMEPAVGVSDYVLTLTFAKNASVELVEGAKYPVTITYLGSKDVGAANWNEDPIGFNVEVKDITVTAAEEDYITYTSVAYDVATSKLTVGRAAPNQKLSAALKAGTANGNRKVQLVVNVDGKEFLFAASITSGAGAFTASGFALPHMNVPVSISIRITADNDYLVNTNSYDVVLADLVAEMAATDTKAAALVDLMAAWSTTEEVIDVTNANVEKGAVDYTTVTYAPSNSELVINRAAPSQELQAILKAGTANGNRKVQLVVDVNGTEFLFAASITSGTGAFKASGFALPHFTQNVKVYIRVTSGASGDYVVNTNAVTVNLDSVMKNAADSAFASAYNAYCAAE